MIKYSIGILIGLFLFFCISCSFNVMDKTVSSAKSAAPKPGDCNACHEGKEVLPQGHAGTTHMTNTECNSCHSGQGSLFAKIPLEHRHKLAGMSCNECHKEPAPYTAVDSAVCLSCHGDTKALFEATRDFEINPHYSPHDGKISDCNKCHHQHKSSVNYCLQCHGS